MKVPIYIQVLLHVAHLYLAAFFWHVLPLPFADLGGSDYVWWNAPTWMLMTAFSLGPLLYRAKQFGDAP